MTPEQGAHYTVGVVATLLAAFGDEIAAMELDDPKLTAVRDALAVAVGPSRALVDYPPEVTRAAAVSALRRAVKGAP